MTYYSQVFKVMTAGEIEVNAHDFAVILARTNAMTWVVGSKS